MKKVIAVFLVLLIITSIVFAKGAAETTARPEVVKLQVWYALSGTSGESFKSKAEAFDMARPDIELELTYSGNYADTATKVSAALLSGDAPDVAVMAAGQLYTGGRGDFSMEEFAKDPEFNISDVYPGMLEYGKFDDRLAAIPFGISTQVLYYNKAIFNAAGINLERNPPKTWEELLAFAKIAVEKGNINKSSDFYGFDTSDGVWLIKSMFSQNGNPVVKKAGDKIVPVFNEASGVEVATFWKKMIDSGIMPAGQHNNAEKKFLAGNLAIIAASSNRISRWQGNTSFELGAIPMPKFSQNALALGGNVMVILSEGQFKKEAGWELVKHMLKEENQTDFALSTGYLPIRKSSQQNPKVQELFISNPLYKIAFEQLDYTWAYLHFNEMGTMDAMFWYALDEIEKAVLSPKAALDKAAASLIKEME